MEDAAGEGVYDEDGSVEGVEQDVVGGLFADAVHGQELAAQVLGGTARHELNGVGAVVAEVFAQRSEPLGLDSVEADGRISSSRVWRLMSRMVSGERVPADLRLAMARSTFLQAVDCTRTAPTITSKGNRRATRTGGRSG